MAHRERFHTKPEIVKLASQLFLTEGFTNTTAKKIADELDISQGNLTYHFPTKDHLLAELVSLLCEYYQIAMEQETQGNRDSLLSYCLEITSMMVLCEEDAVAKDLYTAAYTHSLSLALVREADTARTQKIFASFCPDWTDEDFVMTEAVVSGIEYSALMTDGVADIPLDRRIAKLLNSVLRLYHVPAELRHATIDEVLAMDYHRIGRQFVEGFMQYVGEVTRQAIEDASAKRR